MYELITRDFNKKDMPIISRTSYPTRRELTDNLPRGKRIERPDRGKTYIVLQTS